MIKRDFLFKGGIYIFIGILLILSVLFFCDINTMLIYFPVSALFLLCMFPILIIRNRKEIDFFEPIFSFSLIYFFVYGVGAIFITYYRQFDRVGLCSYIPIVLNGVLLGYFFFLLGYYNRFSIFIVSRIPSLPQSWNQKIIPKIALLMYAIGWLARLIKILRGSYYLIDEGVNLPVQLTGILSLFYSFAFYGFALFSVFYFSLPKKAHHKRLWRIIFFIMFLLELVFTIPTGRRYEVVYVLAIVLIAYSYSKKKLPTKWILSSLIIFFLIIFPFIDSYRLVLPKFAQGDSDITISLSTIQLAAKEAAYRLSLKSTAENFEYNFKRVISRFECISRFGAVMRDTPKAMDFQYGKTYLVNIFAFIPRAIWPGKPKQFNYNKFGRAYSLIQPIDTKTAVVVPLLAEFFINFHLIGIMIGMFLYGMFLRIFYIYAIKKFHYAPLGIFLYAISWLTLITPESDSSSIVGLIRNIIMVFLVIWFLRGWKKSGK